MRTKPPFYCGVDGVFALILDQTPSSDVWRNSGNAVLKQKAALNWPQALDDVQIATCGSGTEHARLMSSGFCVASEFHSTQMIYRVPFDYVWILSDP